MEEQKNRTFRDKWHEIIFEADTRQGKLFDVVLLILISLSVLVVIIESIESISKDNHYVFIALEWVFTILFTIEYIARIVVIKKPTKYIFSFFGIIDLLSILPLYLSYILTGSHYLIVIRTLRLLRVFRIFKLSAYLKESRMLLLALRNSRSKITVFIFTVIMLTTVIGALMYVVEGPENGFDSIPQGMYWSIVTLTTVGYGDITPATSLGKFLSSLVMILGYGIIAVPTGIVTSEITRVSRESVNTQSCQSCSREGHDDDAIYCKYCGETIHGQF